MTYDSSSSSLRNQQKPMDCAHSIALTDRPWPVEPGSRRPSYPPHPNPLTWAPMGSSTTEKRKVPGRHFQFASVNNLHADRLHSNRLKWDFPRLIRKTYLRFLQISESSWKGTLTPHSAGYFACQSLRHIGDLLDGKRLGYAAATLLCIVFLQKLLRRFRPDRAACGRVYELG